MPKKAVNKKQCSCCGRVRSVSDFYECFSLSTQFFNRIPFCRSCAKQKYDIFTKKFNDDTAIWLMCAEGNIPYIQEWWNGAKVKYNQQKVTMASRANPFTCYYSEYYAMAQQADGGELVEGFWTSDRTFEELAYPEVFEERQQYKEMIERYHEDKKNDEAVYLIREQQMKEELERLKQELEEQMKEAQEQALALAEEEEAEAEADEYKFPKNIKKYSKSQIKQFVANWGYFSEGAEAYDFLEKTFKARTKEIAFMDFNLETRYRDLCKAEYKLRLAYENGDMTEISKAQTTVKELLKLLKLDEFQKTKQSEEELHIERMAWLIENTQPAELEDLDAYRDFGGIEKHWKHIMRCVQNLIAGTKDYPDLPKDERFQ